MSDFKTVIGPDGGNFMVVTTADIQVSMATGSAVLAKTEHEPIGDPARPDEPEVWVFVSGATCRFALSADDAYSLGQRLRLRVSGAIEVT
jgi:hypothetical protein